MTGADRLEVVLGRTAKRAEELRAERDEAQEACRAWRGVYETLEAHLMDRVAMQDEASPETYLSILRSSVAHVERDSEQLLNARWARESEATRQRDEAVAQRDALGETARDFIEALDWCMDDPVDRGMPDRQLQALKNALARLEVDSDS